MKIKIKIICTLGPSSLNKNVIIKFKSLGVDLYRINMSHTSLRSLEKKIIFLKKLGIKNICIDTEGAQIRTKCKKKIFLKKGEKIKISNNIKSKLFFFSEINFSKLKINTIIKVGFDNLQLKILKIIKSNYFLTEVVSSGILEKNKGVHFSRNINLPCLTEKDKEAILIAKKNNVKYFALSFASHPNDVKKLRKLIGKKSFLISKIETKKAITNLKSIIKNSDAILIDRGDLSRYVNYEKIPIAQEVIIKEGIKRKKDVYVATNLLESMINNFFPSRAESHDIYNTLNQGAKGLVLAAETAIGNNPLEVVKYIKKSIKVFKNKKKYKRNVINFM